MICLLVRESMCVSIKCVFNVCVCVFVKCVLCVGEGVICQYKCFVCRLSVSVNCLLCVGVLCIPVTCMLD